MDVSLATFWTRVNFLAPWVAVFPVLFQNKRWKGLKRAQKDTKGSKQRKQRWFGVMFRFECLCFARMSHTWHSTQNILESFTSVVLHSTQAFELSSASARVRLAIFGDVRGRRGSELKAQQYSDYMRPKLTAVQAGWVFIFFKHILYRYLDLRNLVPKGLLMHAQL
jgi:hypothetical protein